MGWRSKVADYETDRSNKSKLRHAPSLPSDGGAVLTLAARASIASNHRRRLGRSASTATAWGRPRPPIMPDCRLRCAFGKVSWTPRRRYSHRIRSAVHSRPAPANARSSGHLSSINPRIGLSPSARNTRVLPKTHRGFGSAPKRYYDSLVAKVPHIT